MKDWFVCSAEGLKGWTRTSSSRQSHRQCSQQVEATSNKTNNRTNNDLITIKINTHEKGNDQGDAALVYVEVQMDHKKVGKTQVSLQIMCGVG
ncbi:hypothetical protein Hanom_Chr02g00176271 [Helianthus anomalus]